MQRENSLRIRDNLVSHFPNRVYNGLEDLTETIMNPANCHSNKVSMPMKDNYSFAFTRACLCLCRYC